MVYITKAGIAAHPTNPGGGWGPVPQQAFDATWGPAGWTIAPAASGPPNREPMDDAGVWSSTLTYMQGDVVDRLGTSYVALQASTNQDPQTATAYWRVLGGGGGGGGAHPNLATHDSMGLATDAELSAVNITRFGTVTYTVAGAVSVQAGQARFQFPASATLIGVVASVGAAPTGAALIVDVNKNGTTIFTTTGNRPTIAAGANSTASMPAPNVTAVVAGDWITVDIDQVGSGVPGSDLVIVLYFRWN